MSNRITIELCAEDRQRLDELIAFAGLIASEMKTHNDSEPATMEPLKVVTPAEEHPVDAVSPHGEPEPVAVPAADPEPELPKYSKDDILAKVQSLAGPNNPKREKAKAIVKRYGTKISDIPEDKYGEVMAELLELEVSA